MHMEAIILSKEQFVEIQNQLKEITTRLDSKNQPSKNQFVDNEDFIRMMKISKRTAQTWRDEGKISFSQIGGKIYYNTLDIEKLLIDHYNKAFAR